MSPADWQAAWPRVLEGISGEWEQLKVDNSGVVAAGQIELAGRSVQVIAKRPYRTRWSQWLGDLVRGGRARRTWNKTWELFSRGLPTEVPLLLMEKKLGPLVIGNLVLFERIPGTNIDRLDLDELSTSARQDLLRQVGAVLRDTERHGFVHRDAKATNWMAFPDAAGAFRPVMLDCYGVRRFGGRRAGLRRFLKALSRHRAFKAQDAASVCDGYAPEGWPAPVRQLHDHYAARAKPASKF